MLEDLDRFAEEVNRLAIRKGWWPAVRTLDGLIPEKLALVHSEVSEALECFRNDQMRLNVSSERKPEGFGVEIADAMIRCMDLYVQWRRETGEEASLSELLQMKHHYNLTRPDRHGGKKA